MTFLPVAIFWLIAIWAVVSKRPVLLYLFFGSMAFGTFAVVPPELTLGLTFTATPIVTLLIIARALMTRTGVSFFLTQAVRVDRLGLLFLFWIVAVLTTLIMPRLFAEEVMVVPIRGIIGEASLLEPTAQNISQLVYMTISVFAVFAFTFILRSRADRQAALKALCFGGGVAVATGFVDYLSLYLPLSPLLEPFRTATYALATNIEVLGSKRVVGLMPEASSFGGLCLGLVSALVFFRRAIADSRVRNIYAPIIIAALLLCCWLSTSSGTYLGVAALVMVVFAEAVLRIFSRGRSKHLYRQDLVGELTVAAGLFVISGIVIMAFPAVIEPVYALVDRMVVQKSDSASFIERAMWRSVAYESIFATHGLGVGLGSTRASSSLVSIFSGAGIVGGLLYYAFVLQTLLRRSVQYDWEGQFILAAFRFSFIPTFVLSLLVGGADFGPLLAFGFGIVTAVTLSGGKAGNRQQASPRDELPRAHGQPRRVAAVRIEGQG